MMPVASGRMELWRRIALLFGILVGIGLFFYVTPSIVKVTAVDWQKEHAGELRSISGYVSSEKKRLNQLPLEDYINEKTGGKVTLVDAGQWKTFFHEVQLASNGEYARSIYGNRVSPEDKDDFWKPTGPVPVFFKPDEFPFAQWGLSFESGKRVYIRTNEGTNSYLLLEYEDYHSELSAMYTPYRVAPGWLYHPYRSYGIGVMAAGLLLYIFLPRRKAKTDDIAYTGGTLVAGDVVAVIILLTFYGLPFFINGGTVQTVTSMWPISLVMWFMALFGVVVLYYSAWYASFRIELTEDALYLITFKGVRELRFAEINSAGLVSLRNPGWFRKLFMAIALLSFLGGRSSPQPVGGAVLAATAAYGGLELIGIGKPLYIWYTDQWGGITIRNFNRVTEAIHSAGIRINNKFREIEGFSMFM
ncbi:MAG: hypothetical protein GX949_01605 [Peptococcaceae bacterium]|jgi:uncharacterized membrane protein|nr:hypothetical protein [Peptococcaceae bacterium]